MLLSSVPGESYVTESAREDVSAANTASRKEEKYAISTAFCFFAQIVVESTLQCVSSPAAYQTNWKDFPESGSSEERQLFVLENISVDAAFQCCFTSYQLVGSRLLHGLCVFFSSS